MDGYGRGRIRIHRGTAKCVLVLISKRRSHFVALNAGAKSGIDGEIWNENGKTRPYRQSVHDNKGINGQEDKE